MEPGAQKGAGADRSGLRTLRRTTLIPEAAG